MINLKYKYIIVVIISFLWLKCTNLNISNDGGESGYDLLIYNYSDEEYTGCVFYMGYLNSKEDFIATDSLAYPNLTIYKKNEGDNVNVEYGFSITNPFINSNKGLNEYGFWQPNLIEINSNSNGKIYFMVKINDQKSLSSSAPGQNGTTILRILEDGQFSW